jgi:hypothetical protein
MISKLSEIINRLQFPIPPDLIKSKTKGGNKIIFVSWYDYCTLLDERSGLGNWSWEIRETSQIGNSAVVVGRLTIYGEDRSISFDATGNEDVDRQGFGDALSCAESMALRRACAKCGLGRYLWDKDDPEFKDAQSQPKTFSPSPTYKTNGKGEISREQWVAKFGG